MVHSFLVLRASRVARCARLVARHVVRHVVRASRARHELLAERVREMQNARARHNARKRERENADGPRNSLKRNRLKRNRLKRNGKQNTFKSTTPNAMHLNVYI